MSYIKLYSILQDTSFIYNIEILLHQIFESKFIHLVIREFVYRNGKLIDLYVLISGSVYV